MILQFDELLKANELIENGFKHGYTNYVELCWLVKYYRWSLNYSPVKTKKEIIKFCEENDNEFNLILNRNLIKKVVSKAEQYKPRSPKAIFITDIELKKIRSVSNFQWQKILFIIILIAKFLKYNNPTREINKKPEPIGYYISNSYKPSITHYAHANIGQEKLSYIIHEFVKLGLLKPTNPEYNSNKILFADDNGKPVIFVEDYFDPIKYFIDYCGGEKIYCEKCGVEIERMGKNHKMCEDCWKKREKEIKRNWWNKNK